MEKQTERERGSERERERDDREENKQTADSRKNTDIETNRYRHRDRHNFAQHVCDCRGSFLSFQSGVATFTTYMQHKHMHPSPLEIDKGWTREMGRG